MKAIAKMLFYSEGRPRFLEALSSFAFSRPSLVFPSRLLLGAAALAAFWASAAASFFAFFSVRFTTTAVLHLKSKILVNTFLSSRRLA
jgi:hypothetical protein